MPGLRAQVDFSTGSDFSYLKGKDAASLPNDWVMPAFDDAAWEVAPAPFWYGDGSGGTLLDDMQNAYTTLYLRTTFEASQLELLEDLLLSINYDDGFALWINGVLAESKNAPLEKPYNSVATFYHESGSYESMILDDPELIEGINTLAIQVFNFNLSSSDVHMDLSLSAGVRLPVLVDSVGMTFSHASGYYDDPFELLISASNPEWNILYTLDGSNPQDSPSALSSTGPALIQIDPASTANRAATPAVVVRASAEQPGMKAAYPEARTFIFPASVISQSHPGGDWPTWDVNGQIIDLAMAPDVTQSGSYAARMLPSLKSLPSISVSIGTASLFDPSTGIYVNALEHGKEWERFCSVELIFPDSDSGFSVNAGLRIRGGWSRNPSYPRHGFRLFFRSEYGMSKLEYPLFGDEGVEVFDKIDLRNAQNYAWSNGNSNHTFLRDVFSRDIQGDMGQPYTRSRYYHLYLDGMYWGVCQTQERSEARYAESYFGADYRDYDVVKVNTEDRPYSLEATDGNLESWQDLYNRTLTGFSDNASYYAMEGKNAQGEAVPGGKVRVDLDNLIDYMLIIFYTGNFDAPTSSFGGNKWGNNYYAIDNREDFSSGFKFFVHDSEHAMFDQAHGPGIGLQEDRVNLQNQTDGNHMYVESFPHFHPQWLHYKLTSNEEYRLRFRDRAHRHFGPGGVFTREHLLQRLNQRASEVEVAMVSESARWGDAKSGSSFTVDNHWKPAVNRIRNNLFPYRGDVVINQLAAAKLYSSLSPPDILLDGAPVNNRSLEANDQLTLFLENSLGAGELWFTTNGEDPRLLGGEINSRAMNGGVSGHQIDVTGSLLLKVRIQRSIHQWSPLTELRVLWEDEDYSNLVVTELQYNPADVIMSPGDTLYSPDLEFLEFKNTGENALHLGGLVLDSGIYYEFPEGTLLPPLQFYVLSSEPASFYRLYGLVPSGDYKKNLDNGGEQILLRTTEGKTIYSFFWSDQPPWPDLADGLGHSMTAVDIDPSGSPNIPEYWRNSTELYGSPFADDTTEIIISTKSVDEEKLQIYPNPVNDLLRIEMSSGRSGDLQQLYLFDLQGRMLHSREFSHQTELSFEGMNLPGGIYLLQVHSYGGIYSRKVIYTKAQ